MPENLKISVVLVVVALGAGVLVGEAIWHVAEPAKVEAAAPAETQADGSVVLERDPTKAKAPPKAIPKGGKVERAVSVTVKPRAVFTEPGAVNTEKPCPPVTVDLALVKMPDQTRRVVASSPDGDVVAGIDIPVAPLPAERKWAAGLSYDPIYQTPGIWVERDVGPVRVGVDVNQTRTRIAGPTGVEARLRVGWAF